jgi:hypothetical protein
MRSDDELRITSADEVVDQGEESKLPLGRERRLRLIE